MTQPVLECEKVNISYYTRAGEIPAVVDFDLKVMPQPPVSSTKPTSPPCPASASSTASAPEPLKNYVHHFLKNHDLVERFAFAPPDQGGNGATIAELKL